MLGESRSVCRGMPQPKKRSRPRPLPPEVTSRNLAIEKKRREEMNQNLLVHSASAHFPRSDPCIVQ